MKLVVYKRTIPNKALYHKHKVGGINAFIAGAQKHGVSVVESNDIDYVKSDIGLMFSFVDLHAPEDDLIPYMQYRKNIFMNGNKNLFFFENDVLKDLNGEMYVARFPFRSVYDHEAEYFLENIPEERNNAFSNFKISKPQKTKDGLVVINLNRLGGYGRCGVDQFKWAYELIRDLKATHITIRVHPGNTSAKARRTFRSFTREVDHIYYDKIKNEFPKVNFLLPQRGSFVNSVSSNKATHIFSSSSASCESIVMGKRTVVSHPSAFAYNFSPKSYEEQTTNDAEGLLRKYKKTHFTIEEVESGLYWDYIKEGVKNYL